MNDSLAYSLLKAQHNLSISARLAHWNIRGRDFYEGHLLFSKVYEIASDKVDTLVETMRALGYSPTFEEFSGPSGALPSFDYQDLVEMLVGYATSYYSALVRLRESASGEPESIGLVNLLEQLCEDCLSILYLLSSSRV